MPRTPSSQARPGARQAGLFERNLAAYTSYHTDWRNRATHFIGIPMIVFAVMLALVTVKIWAVNLGVFAAGAMIGAWLGLERRIGLAMLLPMLLLLALALWLAAALPLAAVLWLALGLFVAGWALQLIGHGFEGRRPAFADNLGQLVIGPMFLMAEMLEAAEVYRRPDSARGRVLAPSDGGLSGGAEAADGAGEGMEADKAADGGPET